MHRTSGFALLFLAVAFLWAAPAAHAQELGDDDGPVFLIVSLNRAPVDLDGDGTFAFDTTVTLVNVGALTGGGTAVGDTRFLINAGLPTVPLPTLTGFDLGDLNGNEATILGSFQTTTAPHIVIPARPGAFPAAPGGVVPQAVQTAVFQATRSEGFSSLLPNDGVFPTTADIAEYIAGFQNFEDEVSDFTAEQIAGFIFETEMTVTASATSCEGEAGLFPWEPGDQIFIGSFAFDDGGDITALDVPLFVEIEVKPSTVNLKKSGSISVAIYESDSVDTDEIDETTVEIGGVFADKVTFSSKKATAHFSVQDLVDAGVLTSTTTEVTLRALLSDGNPIQGTSPIKVK
ncbi:MAG: hypothetical protein ACHQ1G_09645 [Planctomycetota bacterium]